MSTTTAPLDTVAGTYPVAVTLDVRLVERNRLTVFLRPLLAIPHSLLVGPAAWVHRAGTAGFIGSAAYVLALVNWFALLVWGDEVRGVRDFQLFYLRWRTRALAYMALFTDEYPPFGDGAYPASIDVTAPGTRDRATIAVRPLLAVPHLLALFFLLAAWLVTTVVAWVAILLNGEYPAPLARFGAGTMRWVLRVEAYLLLLTDEYPPFALE